MPGTPRALRSFGVGAAKGSAMAARAYWKGQIRLALVSIPVEIYAATKSGAAISFRQIHEPSGKPVKYEKVVPGIGPIDTDEIGRATCRERVCQYVLISVVTVSLKKKKKQNQKNTIHH